MDASTRGRRGGLIAGIWTLCVGLGLAVAGPATANAAEHVVARGESLSRIAKGSGCTVAELQRANALGGRSVIYPGQKLTIPSCSKEHDSKDTSKPAASTSPAAGDELVRHRVRKGESLSRIASRYGCSPGEIRARNNLRGSTLVPGMELLVPRGAGRFEAPLVKGQSVGKPHRGRLVDGVQMPSDRAYYRRRSARAWGAAHAVAYTREAIKTVRTRYPKIHRLAIGDLSREGGGSLPGHRSHQSGRDVDLGFYYRRRPSEYPKEFAPGTKHNLDLAATWTLIDALLATRKLAGGVEHIFLDYELQGLVYNYAKDHGVSRALLREVFQYPHGKGHGGALIQHVPAHHDHLHIRYKCPPGDSGCK